MTEFIKRLDTKIKTLELKIVILHEVITSLEYAKKRLIKLEKEGLNND